VTTPSPPWLLAAVLIKTLANLKQSYAARVPIIGFHAELYCTYVSSLPMVLMSPRTL